MSNPADAFSFGGGVQSTAALVLAAQGDIDFRKFVFSDVGSDAENPATVNYFWEHALPYACSNDIDLLRVEKRWRRNGQASSLLQYLNDVETSVPIPMRLPGAGPSNRLCTIRWKLEPVRKWQISQGATEANPARLGLGISTDEIARVRTKSRYAEQELTYPLIDMSITRADCASIIAAAGLPVPPKSSCWFCPCKSRAQWRDMMQNDPDLWGKAVELEAMLRDRRSALGRDPGGFAGSGRHPLPVAVDDQLSMFDDGEQTICDGASCFT